MIEARQLVKRFGAQIAVDDVSFVVSPGEIYCVLGGRSSGKTTLVNLFVGSIEATAGQAFIGGRDVRKWASEVRKLATFVVGGGGLYPAMTARENVAFFAKLGATESCRRPAIESAMRRMCVPDRCFDVRVRDLRPGMSVLLWLAVAALREAPAVVLDDPLLRADGWAIEQIQEGLEDFVESGRAVLVTTSDMPFATRIASRVGILQAGRLVSEHSKRDLLNQRVLTLLDQPVESTSVFERTLPPH